MVETVKWREYQSDIIGRATNILKTKNFVYLAMEVRTGKTLTSLGICEKVNAENVLFLTKKKAIQSISDDYDLLCPVGFSLFTINYESMHKAPNIKWDVIICDESHSLGAFPKPNKRAKGVRDLIVKTGAKVVLLSGTPTPESYSQMYHQVYGIKGNPFATFKNFYRFCDRFVNVTERKINGLMIRDYSNGMQSILDAVKPFTISLTQKEAGFVTETTEDVLEVKMLDTTYNLANKLKKDLVVEGNDEVVLADTPVKLMMKLHQIYSGTVKFEGGNSMIVDYSKAEFIKEHFKGKKIGIFYKFKEELNALKKVFGDDLVTELGLFQQTNKHIALQIVSGREGISLKDADCLVYYNIDFSATSYWQSKDRMTTKERLKNKVYWIFSKGGIESKIYKAVTKKKDYTLRHFKRDLLSL
jgi:hypothetical protein